MLYRCYLTRQRIRPRNSRKPLPASIEPADEHNVVDTRVTGVSAVSSQSSDGTRLALVHAYLECRHCGRIPMPTGAIFVLPGSDSPDRVHCHLRCDRCGSEEAKLYLERELMPVH